MSLCYGSFFPDESSCIAVKKEKTTFVHLVGWKNEVSVKPWRPNSFQIQIFLLEQGAGLKKIEESLVWGPTAGPTTPPIESILQSPIVLG